MCTKINLSHRDSHHATFSRRESRVLFFSLPFAKAFLCNQHSALVLQREVATYVGKFHLITCVCSGVLSCMIYSFWPAGEQRSTSKSKALFALCCWALSLLLQVPGSYSTPTSFCPPMNWKISRFLAPLHLDIRVESHFVEAEWKHPLQSAEDKQTVFQLGHSAKPARYLTNYSVHRCFFQVMRINGHFSVYPIQVWQIYPFRKYNY